MDWLLVGVIGAAMYFVGNAIGWRTGFEAGKAIERVSRRIDEVTGTRRL